MANFQQLLESGSISLLIPEDTKKLKAIMFEGEIPFSDLISSLKEIRSLVDGPDSGAFGFFLRMFGCSPDLSDLDGLDLSKWTFNGGRLFNTLNIEQLTTLLSEMPAKFAYVRTVDQDSPDSWLTRQDLTNWLVCKKAHQAVSLFNKSNQNPEPPKPGSGAQLGM